MKKALILWIISVFCFFLSGCLITSSEETTTTLTSTSTTITTTTTTITTISTTTHESGFDFLDELPPTDVAIRFDPSGFLSTSTWFWHSAPVFSPDGSEMYWSKYLVGTNQIHIWYTHRVDGRWTSGVRLDIEGIDGDTNCPTFVAGDEGLYFINYDGGSFTLYRATRTESGWGNAVEVIVPLPVGQYLGWEFSISENKNLYLPLSVLGNPQVSQIYVSVYTDNGYATPILIENQGSGMYGNIGPEIAPDESYLMFASRRDEGFGYHDLYICFRTGEGTFSEPLNMGEQINTNHEDGRAQITADGQYLFFTTSKTRDLGYNPYWIRIDELDVFNQK